MADMPPLGPHELYAYEPPISLWELIKSYVPQHELVEVKNLLGESMVEQSLELQQEVKTLLEIWRDYRSETENNLMYHRLPEPPAARERLKHEIKFFIDSIREKSQTNGSNFTDILTKHNKNVLDYVLENKRPETACGSRPSTARSSRDGRDTPLTVSTQDRLCQGSLMSNNMDSMKDSLNFLQLDGVVQHLRETLMDEVQWLLKDIDFLQNCLEDEADFRTNPSISREPSLADLREERTKLEKDLLADDMPRGLRDMNITQTRHVPLPNATVKPLIRASPHASPPITPPQSGRPSPMRASHQISTQTLTLSKSDSNTALRTLSNLHSIHNQHENGSRSASGSLSRESSAGTQRTTSSRESSAGSQITKGSRRSRSPTSVTGSPSDRLADGLHKLVPEAPTHLSIKTGLPPNSKVVKVGSIPLGHSDVPQLIPSPPSGSKPSSARPGSAHRFRRMVLECRDSS